MKVATACRLFGHCRQAFYQSKADIEAEVNRDKIILDNVREIRDEDPGIGGYKLWLMLTELYGREKCSCSQVSVLMFTGINPHVHGHKLRTSLATLYYA